VRLPNNKPTNAEGKYHPTQVRLYGIPGLIPEILGSGSVEISKWDDRPSITIDLRDPAKAKAELASVQKLIDVLAKDRKKQLIPEAKKIWGKAAGIPLPGYFLNLTTKLVGSVFVGMWKKDQTPLSSGIMFGYAYEGHTYDFPKPKVMLVPALPLSDPADPRRPADDSGYDAKYSEGYRVWLVDKLDHCVEIEVNQGFVEEIVLEANLPGKRSPTMYGAKMALAHRSGRLSE
jgi:hypothetical protein